MEYQTCPLAEGKSSSTFDEDGGLNRNRSSDESSGRGGEKKKKDNRGYHECVLGWTC